MSPHEPRPDAYYWATAPAAAGAPAAGPDVNPAASFWAPAPPSESRYLWGTGAQPRPKPARFSALAAFALVAACAPVAATAVDLGLGSHALYASCLSILLAVAALTQERITNRWMAVVALVVGSAPLVLLGAGIAFLAFIMEGYVW